MFVAELELPFVSVVVYRTQYHEYVHSMLADLEDTDRFHGHASLDLTRSPKRLPGCQTFLLLRYPWHLGSAELQHS